jgi:hypothetical protein
MGLLAAACWMGEYWSLDRDITFLEIIPTAFSIFLWHKLLYKNKIVYSIDNMTVVSILESKTSKSARMMVLLIFIVYWLLVWHLHFKAVHISYVHNAIADSLSRGQFQRFRELAPTAELKPMMILWECWNLLKQSSTVFCFCFYFLLYHNIVYSKSLFYNNLNGPGVNIKGPCFT